jgi:hypothetical protein
MLFNSPPHLTAPEQIIYSKLLKVGIKLLKRAQIRCVQVITPPNATNSIKIKAAAYALVKSGYKTGR